jgi:hypothetical protein
MSLCPLNPADFASITRADGTKQSSYESDNRNQFTRYGDDYRDMRGY